MSTNKTNPISRPTRAAAAPTLGVAGAIGPVLLALLVNAGQLKGTSLLAWMPVDLTLALAVSVSVWSLIRLPHDGIRLRKMVPFVILLFLLAIAALQSVSTSYSSVKELTLFSVTAVLMFTPFVLLGTKPQQRLFFSTLVAVAALAALFMIVSPETVADYSTRIVFEGTNTIGAARVLGVGAVVCFVRLVWDPMRWSVRLAYAALILVFIWGMLSSGSRGPFLAAAAALLILTVVAVIKKKASWRVVSVAALLIIGGGVAMNLASADGATRIFGFFGGVRDTSTNARNGLWEDTLAAISSHPWGVGLGQFSHADVSNVAAEYPHNIVLETFVEGGWAAGFVLCVILVTAAIRALRFSQPTTGFVTLAVLTFTTANAMVSGDLNSNRLLWVAVALALMLHSTSREPQGVLDSHAVHASSSERRTHTRHRRRSASIAAR